MTTLTVTVHEAKDLISADHNGFSDPYALVFVGKNKPKKTKIVKKSLSPKWEEAFEFPITRHDTTLQVQVWDWDRIGSDDFLGLIHVDLSPVHKGHPEQVKAGWLRLQPHPSKKVKVKGGIKISVAAITVNYSAANAREVNKQVASKIKAVVASRQKFFDISGVGAASLEPSWLTQLPPSITSINLSFNQLSSLPAELGQVQGLISLFGSGNQISAWPSQASSLQHLVEVELNGNELRELPADFGRLQKLEKLNLANNKLASLPPTVGYLYRMEELNLSGNDLANIPATVGNCYKLELLDLSCCSIRSLPEELTYCTRLIELNLGSNRMSALPQAVGRLSRLVSLNVSDNLLKDLPISIGYCASLQQIGQGLNIDRNPLRDKEMAKQYRIGADRLFAYLEKRMMMVGMPRLPPFPNGGKLPYVPMPPIDGKFLPIGNSSNALGVKRDYSSPINLKSRLSNRSSPAMSRTASSSSSNRSNHGGSSSSGRSSPVVATKEEKVDKIRIVAKAVIERDIKPKLKALSSHVNEARTLSQIQPHVYKVKSLRNEFDAIKRILPELEAPPAAADSPDKLQKVKNVVGVILFEYELILGISMTVVDVASSKDLVALVNALKRLKALLH